MSNPTPTPAPVRVVFRSFAECGAWNDPDGVIALFPDADEGGGRVQSYMHHGQHAPADPELIHTLYGTTPAQRAPLVAELESLGYVLDIDTSVPGRPSAPHGDREEYSPYGRFRSLRVNADARAAVVARVPFANRSHSLTGRALYVPVGTTFDRVDADGATAAHIVVHYPGRQPIGEHAAVVTTDALPPTHVSALLRTLVSAARDPETDHVLIVSSYRTPILWTDSLRPDAAEHVPPVCYSATTTKHQQDVTGAGYMPGRESIGRGRAPFGPRAGSW